MKSNNLTAYRKLIDELDEELIKLLSRRFRITEEIGELKAVQGLQALDSQREKAQLQRLTDLAGQHNVNPEVVFSIFRAIVNDVVSNHLAISKRLASEKL